MFHIYIYVIENFHHPTEIFGQVRQTYWQPRPEEASYARLNAIAETAERLLHGRCLDRREGTGAEHRGTGMEICGGLSPRTMVKPWN